MWCRAQKMYSSSLHIDEKSWRKNVLKTKFHFLGFPKSSPNVLLRVNYFKQADISKRTQIQIENTFIYIWVHIHKKNQFQESDEKTNKLFYNVWEIIWKHDFHVTFFHLFNVSFEVFRNIKLFFLVFSKFLNDYCNIKHVAPCEV